jgi:hypothetical protein
MIERFLTETPVENGQFLGIFDPFYASPCRVTLRHLCAVTFAPQDPRGPIPTGPGSRALRPRLFSVYQKLQNLDTFNGALREEISKDAARDASKATCRVLPKCTRYE